jgi:hypothetical protein
MKKQLRDRESMETKPTRRPTRAMNAHRALHQTISLFVFPEET